jgi:hypothetical protein
VVWLDEPATRPTNLARVEPVPYASAPCAAADLSDGWVEDNGDAGGRWVQTIVVSNKTDAACTLSGSADIRGRSTGEPGRVTVPARRIAPDRSDDSAQYPATLMSGALARIDVSMNCPSGGPYPTPALRDPGIVIGGIERSVAALVVAPGCDVAVGDWYWLRPLLNAWLTVSIEAPPSVRRGETFVYEVSLLNTYDDPFSIRPCPVYYQKLGDQVEWRRLNCAVSWVPGHARVRFEMRMRVAGDAPTGPARLSWMAVMADGRVATANMDTGGAAITITG